MAPATPGPTIGLNSAAFAGMSSPSGFDRELIALREAIRSR